ncbi:hypothetical protein [Thermococcus stetteri]|uniref:hypothetical protein n=1 Tax=Thermococcus stetteri TaxID=49900 RepID=UPI001AEB94C6|nr:hypothetical protein [Thermococcus stetteri]MBP1911788.1 hypothetical protein [Thermococcus stetteri]
MRKTRVVDERRHKFLVRSALLDFVIAIVSYTFSGSGPFLVFLTLGVIFILLDRLGTPAVELDIDGTTYWIYPSWNFSEIVVDGGDRRTFPLLPGKNTIEVGRKVINVYQMPRRFFPALFVEFEGEKIKLL